MWLCGIGSCKRGEVRAAHQSEPTSPCSLNRLGAPPVALQCAMQGSACLMLGRLHAFLVPSTPMHNRPCHVLLPTLQADEDYNPKPKKKAAKRA